MAKILRDSSPQAILESVKVLRNGGLVVFPTETCYGFGADAANKSALRKLFEAKGMPVSKKISVMVSDKEMVHCFFGKDPRVDALIDAFLPGPLTIVTKGRSFRIPDYRFCRELAKKFGKPITSTSSNLSGGSDHYTIRPILRELNGVELIIDGGRLPKRKPSTVFDVDKMQVIRKGSISALKIQGVLGQLEIL